MKWYEMRWNGSSPSSIRQVRRTDVAFTGRVRSSRRRGEAIRWRPFSNSATEVHSGWIWSPGGSVVNQGDLGLGSDRPCVFSARTCTGRWMKDGWNIDETLMKRWNWINVELRGKCKMWTGEDWWEPAGHPWGGGQRSARNSWGGARIPPTSTIGCRMMDRGKSCKLPPCSPITPRPPSAPRSASLKWFQSNIFQMKHFQSHQ